MNGCGEKEEKANSDDFRFRDGRTDGYVEPELLCCPEGIDDGELNKSRRVQSEDYYGICVHSRMEEGLNRMKIKLYTN